MSDCKMIELDAEVNMKFRGCAEHGHFDMIAGSLNSGGVAPYDVVDGVLTILVSTLSYVTADYPPIKKMLEYEGRWAWSGEGDAPEQLPDRAKKRIVRVLAQQLLLSHVAEGDYWSDMASAALDLPFLP